MTSSVQQELAARRKAANSERRNTLLGSLSRLLAGDSLAAEYLLLNTQFAPVDFSVRSGETVHLSLSLFNLRLPDRIASIKATVAKLTARTLCVDEAVLRTTKSADFIESLTALNGLKGRTMLIFSDSAVPALSSSESSSGSGSGSGSGSSSSGVAAMDTSSDDVKEIKQSNGSAAGSGSGSGGGSETKSSFSSPSDLKENLTIVAQLFASGSFSRAGTTIRAGFACLGLSLYNELPFPVDIAIPRQEPELSATALLAELRAFSGGSGGGAGSAGGERKQDSSPSSASAGAAAVLDSDLEPYLHAFASSKADDLSASGERVEGWLREDQQTRSLKQHAEQLFPQQEATRVYLHTRITLAKALARSTLEPMVTEEVYKRMRALELERLQRLVDWSSRPLRVNADGVVFAVAPETEADKRKKAQVAALRAAGKI